MCVDLESVNDGGKWLEGEGIYYLNGFEVRIEKRDGLYRLVGRQGQLPGRYVGGVHV